MATHQISHYAAQLVSLILFVSTASAQTYYGEDGNFLATGYGAGFPRASVRVSSGSAACPGFWTIGAWTAKYTLNQPAWYVKTFSSPAQSNLVIPLRQVGSVWKGSHRVNKVVTAPVVVSGSVQEVGAWETFDVTLELSFNEATLVTPTGTFHIPRSNFAYEYYNVTSSASSVPVNAYSSANQQNVPGPLDFMEVNGVITRGWIEPLGVAFDYLGHASSSGGVGAGDPAGQVGINDSGELPVTGTDMITRFTSRVDPETFGAGIVKPFIPGSTAPDRGTATSEALAFLGAYQPAAGDSNWVRAAIGSGFEGYATFFASPEGLGNSPIFGAVRSIVTVLVVLLSMFASYYEIIWGCGLRNPRGLPFDMRVEEEGV